jgi:thiol-disulfide isomerase/thioredoxin
MYVEKGKVRMPELSGGSWLNSDPITAEELRGRAVLVDFWDYTCVNCIRTLPYIVEWHKRYSGKGLVIIGVHAPEFYFSRTVENVLMGIEKFGIKYPVVMDNEYKIWTAFANRAWPAKYLIDGKGYFRYVHLGEGAYIETELAIQLLLREFDPEAALPDPMKPLRDTDIPGIHCYRPSPELYFGHKRGRLGNAGGHRPGEAYRYEKPVTLMNDTLYVEGMWVSEGEYMAPGPESSDDTASIYLKYMSYEVNIVMSPGVLKESKVIVSQDGRSADKGEAGEDVEFDREGRGYFVVSEPRMYNIIRNKEFGSHILELSTGSDGLQFYAFTFIGCVV